MIEYSPHILPSIPPESQIQHHLSFVRTYFPTGIIHESVLDEEFVHNWTFRITYKQEQEKDEADGDGIEEDEEEEDEKKNGRLDLSCGNKKVNSNEEKSSFSDYDHTKLEIQQDSRKLGKDILNCTKKSSLGYHQTLKSRTVVLSLIKNITVNQNVFYHTPIMISENEDESEGEDEYRALEQQEAGKRKKKPSVAIQICTELFLPLIELISIQHPSIYSKYLDSIETILKDCEPLSLSKESAQVLNALDKFLFSILSEQSKISPESRSKVFLLSFFLFFSFFLFLFFSFFFLFISFYLLIFLLFIYFFFFFFFFFYMLRC